MRVVQISTFSEFGAGKAALRLHRALPALGWDSVFYTSAASVPDATAIPPAPGIAARARRRIRRAWLAGRLARARRRGPAFTNFFTNDRTPFGRDALRHLPPADLFNLHWVASFFDPAFLAGLPGPAVWTLHDMNPFTGGCHYDSGCGRFTRGCGRCPALGGLADGDLSARIWRRKRRALARVSPRRLHLVTPSRWLAELAGRSPILAAFPVAVIPNGLDLRVFAPRDRGFARQVFDLPPDARVALFVADRVGEERKGFSLLLGTAEQVPRHLGVHVVTVGRVEARDGTRPGVRHLGFVADERLLALAYRAADVTVVPSLSDNLPGAAVESLACGTPVLGFSAGGIGEIVRDGETGLLVPPADVGALGRALAAVLSDGDRRAAMGARGRAIAEAEYSADVQAARYVEVYRRLFNPAGSEAAATALVRPAAPVA